MQPDPRQQDSFKEKRPSGYRVSRTQMFTPEQMDMFYSMFGNLGPDSYLGKLSRGDEQMFQQIEAPALRQFNELQGNLASRFSGASGNRQIGARRSSGFQNAASQQSADFAQSLQAQRMGLQRQAVLDLFNMQNMLLNQRPYETQLVQKQQKNGGWGQIAGTLLGAAGGSFFGPAGAYTGAVIGGGLGGSWDTGQPMNFGNPFNSGLPDTWAGLRGQTPSTPSTMSGWGGGGALTPTQLQSIYGV